MKTIPTISVTLLGLLFCTACPNWTGAHKREAEEQAKSYAKELGYELKAVSCVRQDTNDDGYVSCSLRFESGGEKDVECAGAYNLNSGCRDQKLAR